MTTSAVNTSFSCVEQDVDDEGDAKERDEGDTFVVVSYKAGEGTEGGLGGRVEKVRFMCVCSSSLRYPSSPSYAANSSEATTVTFVDTHLYPECAGETGSDAKGGSRLFEPNTLSPYFGTCLGHMLGNQGFVHQDVATNQVHAEEGADVLDSGDVGNVVLSTPGLMPTTGNSAPAKNAAAMHYEVGDATIENMAASDPHRVSRGLSSPCNCLT